VPTSAPVPANTGDVPYAPPVPPCVPPPNCPPEPEPPPIPKKNVASGTVDVQSGGLISAKGKGFRQGPQVSGGEGGRDGETILGLETANNGGHPGATSPATYGVESLATFFFGIGGGSGSGGQFGGGTHGGTGGAYGTSPVLAGTGADVGTTGGEAAIGGGIVYIVVKTITVTGAITCDGDDALLNPAGGGGGGGGAGGSILLVSDNLALGTSLVHSDGGTPGLSGGGGAPGTAGGDGRIAINSDFTSKTGTTSPASGIDGTLDLFPEFSSGSYESIVTSFQQAKESARLWIVRNFVAQFNLASAIISGATTLTITGDETAKFANGDTIDISTSDNLVRERKTLTATPTFAAGVTTLTFTSAISNAGGFGTTDFVERVDVIPSVSLVNKGDTKSFQTLIFVQSIVDFTNSEVEDEYSLSTTSEEDLKVKVDITRNDTTLEPDAKRLGIVLSN